VIILGQGAARISAKGFQEEVKAASRELRAEWQQKRQSSRSYLFDNISEELADYVENLRLGKNKTK
jgi:predicted RNA-binding protein with PIN domain